MNEVENNLSPIAPDNTAPGGVKKNDPEVEPISVTIPAARKAIGVGSTTIYELIKQGKLKSFCIGRRRLITWASLKNLANLGGENAQ